MRLPRSLCLVALILVCGTSGKPQSPPSSARDQICTDIMGKKLLQVVFVVETVHQKMQVVQRWILKVIDSIQQAHKKTQFALTSFSDYPGDRGYHPTEVRPGTKGGLGQHGNDKEGCYKFHHPFGTDVKQIKTTVNKLKLEQYNRIDSSSCLTALLFTTADKRIKWVEDSYKVIFFATTNKDSIHHWTDETRKEPLGDGNDKCETHKPPQLSTVQKVLKAKGINKVIGFVGVFYDAKDIYESFNHHLQGIHIDYKLYKCPRSGYSDTLDNQQFVQCTQSDDVTKDIAQYIGDEIQGQVCYNVTKPTTPEPTRPPRSTTAIPTGRPKPTSKPSITKPPYTTKGPVGPGGHNGTITVRPPIIIRPTGPPGPITDIVTIPTILCQCDQDDDLIPGGNGAVPKGRPGPGKGLSPAGASAPGGSAGGGGALDASMPKGEDDISNGLENDFGNAIDSNSKPGPGQQPKPPPGGGAVKPKPGKPGAAKGRRRRGISEGLISVTSLAQGLRWIEPAIESDLELF